MRYEDASGAFQASGPVANDDSDTLAAGSRGPATGNLITGEGTQYGSSGADSAAGAHVTAIAGKGGEDASFAGGKLSVTGEFGQLSVDAEGNYSYMANKGAPENVRDRFTYTLADSAGNSDTAALIVEIGKTPVVIKADAQQIVVGPDGVVTLPPGVELSDIMVVGRNLVVNMPDGTQLIIVDGAVFVPQLVLGGVEVPATNVAALLIGQEPQPAAGESPPSSGGNFALPPPPLDPGVPLGDLLPPTVRDYIPPAPQETFLPLDEDPEVFVQPDGQPASVNAVDQVEEAGLPERDGDLLDEPAGSGEIADGNGTNDSHTGEATAGTIIINAPDGVGSVTINGVLVTGAIGQQIEGEFGTLTITGFSGDDIIYSYLLHDNTSGDDTHDDFSVVLTDEDGDVASATLRIDIIDDVPTARPDTDALAVGEFVETGNVMTDAAPGDADDTDTNAADTVGADNASLTSVSGAGGSDSTFSEGVLTVDGQFGVLTIDAQGNYTYVRNPGSPGGVQDVFNYTLTDGDGDTSTTTLTITIPDTPISILFGNAVSLDDDALPGGNPGGPGDDDPDTFNTEGDLNITGGDGGLTFSLLATGAPDGFTYELSGGDLLIKQGTTTVITVTLDPATGHYTVTQNAPIDHASLDGQAGDNTENNIVFPVNVRVTDADGDTADATGQIIVDDDTPIAVQAVVTGTVDEDGVVEGAADGGEGDGIAGGVGDVAGQNTVASGSVAAMFSGGADVPLSFGFAANAIAVLEGLGLTSNGASLDYAIVGNTVTASTAAGDVFTFELNADGSWEFTLIDQLDHAEGGDENNLTINLGNIIEATDNDGDSVVGNAGGLVITVDDDTPTASEGQVTGVVDEDGVVEGAADGGEGDGIAGGVGDVAGQNTVANGSVAALFNSGADAPLSYGFAANAVAVLEGLGLTSNGAALDYAIVGNTVTASTAAGDVFTFELNADGSWEFTLIDQLDHADGGNENDLAINLGNIIEATDADGDSVVGAADGLVITVDDDTPTASANQVTGTVDEDGVVEGADDGGEGDGIAGGVGDVAGENTVATGSVVTMFNSGADAPLSYGFAANAVAVLEGLGLTSNGVALDYAIVGNTVTASTAAGDVFTFELNADGSWEFTLIDQLDHADGGNENDLAINLGAIIEATDADGDSVVGNANGLIITVDDDTPTASAGQVTGTVDEDGVVEGADDGGPGDGIAGGVGDVAGENTVASGSAAALFNSGADAPLSYGFAANAIAVLEALNLSSNGVALDYAIVGNTVTASTAAGDVFTFELNADGSWEFTLIDQLDHADGANENDLAINLGNVIEATDADGDSVVGNANGLVITVDDDTPTASQNQVTGLVDEDGVVEGAADGGEGDGIPGGVGDVPGAPTVASGSVSSLFNTGADAPLSFGFVANAVAALEGLGLTSNGVALDYAIVGNTVTASTAAGDVFTFELNANGSWEFTLIDQLDHPTLNDLPGDDTENDLTIDLSSIIEATDADGDSVTAAEGGLVITVDDDTPDADNDSAGVGDPGESVTGNVLDNDASGADAPAAVTDVSSNNEPGNSDTNPDPDVFEIQGEFGVLVLNADGSYEYTRDLGTPGGAVDVFTYELTDADGDSVTATLTITLGDATPDLPNPPAVLLDDDALPGGNPGGTGDDVDSQGTPGQLLGTGGDAPLVYNFTGVDTLPGGGSFTTNLVDASTLQILQGATVVLTITLNNATGQFSVVQNNPIDHVAGSDENNYQFLVGVEVEDVDGDVEPASITINVDDDTPTVSANAAVQLDDETEAGGIAGGVGDVDPNTANTSGTLGHSFGADGAGSVAYLTTGAPAGFTYELSGSDLLIKQGTTTVITLTLDPATGQYTVTQNAPINHAAGGNENDASFTINYRVTDGDGDTVDGTLTINSDDDTPTATTTALTGTVDEDGVVENATPGVQAGDGIAGGLGDVAGEVVTAGGNVSALFNSGADQPLTFQLLNSFAALEAQGLESGGVPLTYGVALNSGVYTLTASAGGSTVFTLTLNSTTGAYTFTLVDQLDHPSLDGLAGDDSENELTINLSSIIQATDNDGDSVGAGPNGLIITVDDDMPSIFDPEAIGAGELFNEAGSSATADLDVDANINNNVGADEPGLVQFANIANGDDSGFTSGDDPIEYWLSNNGQTLQGRINSTNGSDGTLIFTVQLNQGVGTYTVTMAGEIDNGSGVTFNNLTSSKAGNVDVRGVGADDPLTAVDLLLTASKNGANSTINTTSTQVGSANQSMDLGETIRIDFVSNLEDDPADDLGTFPSGFSYDGHVGTQSYIQFVPQVQGEQGETVAFRVYALDTAVTDSASPDDTPVAGPNPFSDSTTVPITHVTIDGFDVGETEVTVPIGAIGVWTAVGYGVFAQLQADGSVIFTGVQQGDRYGIETGTDFNAIAVSTQPSGTGPGAPNNSTADTFDLGVFSIGQVDTGDPINLSFDLKLTDFDGDTVTVTDALAIQIDPPADALTLSVQSSSFAGDTSGGDSSLSNLSFSNDNGKWGGHGNDKGFSSVNNTGIVAGMVAAAGLQSTAVAGSPSIESSFDVGLQDMMQTVSLPAYQLQSLSGDSLNVQTFGLEGGEPAFDFSALQGSGHDFSDFVSDGGLDIQSYSDAASGYQPNFQVNQAPAVDASMLAATVAPAVGMPSAEALIAAGVAGVQQGGSVEQILADALGNQAPTVDGLLEAVNGGGEVLSPAMEAALHALPGGGGAGDLAAVLNGSSPDFGSVSSWDMSTPGSIGAGFDMMFKMDVATLHQDAVQPTVNG